MTTGDIPALQSHPDGAAYARLHVLLQEEEPLLRRKGFYDTITALLEWVEAADTPASRQTDQEIEFCRMLQQYGYNALLSLRHHLVLEEAKPDLEIGPAAHVRRTELTGAIQAVDRLMDELVATHGIKPVPGTV